MNTQEIINEIGKLPLSSQREVLETLSEKVKQAELSEVKQTDLSEEELEQEVIRRLVAKGIISKIPTLMTDEEDDEFEPIEIEGEPLSEMIIRERR